MVDIFGPVLEQADIPLYFRTNMDRIQNTRSINNIVRLKLKKNLQKILVFKSSYLSQKYCALVNIVWEH